MSDDSKHKNGRGGFWRGRGGSRNGNSWGRGGGGGWKNNNNNSVNKRSSWKEDIASVIKKISDVVEEHGTIYSGSLEDYQLTKDRKVPKCRRPFNARIYVDEKEGRRKEFYDIFKPLEAIGIVVFKTLKVDDFSIELNFKLLKSTEFKTLSDLAKSTINGHMYKQVVNKQLVNDFRYLGEFGKSRMWVIIQKQCQADVTVSGPPGRGFSSVAAHVRDTLAAAENTMISKAIAAGPSMEAFVGKGCVFNKYKRSSGSFVANAPPNSTLAAAAALVSETDVTTAGNNTAMTTTTMNNSTGVFPLADASSSVVVRPPTTDVPTPLADFVSCTSSSDGFAMRQPDEAHTSTHTAEHGYMASTNTDTRTNVTTVDNGENGMEEAFVEDYSWCTDNARWFDGHPLGRKQLIGSIRHRIMLDGMTVLQTETFEHTAFVLLSIMWDAYTYTDTLWTRYQMDEQPYFDIDKLNVTVTDENMTLSEQLKFIESRENRGVTKQDIEHDKMSAQMALFVSQLKQHQRMPVELAHALAVEFKTPYKLSLYLNEYRDDPQPVIDRLSDVTAETGGARFGPKLAMKIFNNHFGTQHDTTASGKVVLAGSAVLSKPALKKTKRSHAKKPKSAAASDSDGDHNYDNDFAMSRSKQEANSSCIKRDENTLVKKSKHKRRRILDDEYEENKDRQEEETKHVMTDAFKHAEHTQTHDVNMECDDGDVIDMTHCSAAKAAFMPTYLQMKKESTQLAVLKNSDALATCVANTTTEHTLKETVNDQPVKIEVPTSDTKPPKYASKYKRKEKTIV
jgi:hypothetical protein